MSRDVDCTLYNVQCTPNTLYGRVLDSILYDVLRSYSHKL